MALGVMLGALSLRFVASPSNVPADVRRHVRFAGFLGGVVGAYLLQLPADLFAWSAPAAAGLRPIGGRTVLGGLLGGWIAVEIAKARLGYRGATGDRFALPVALGLTFGRIGCLLRGCCEGVMLDVPWQVGSALTVERVPVALIEAYFHAAASGWVVLATMRNWIAGRRLAAYLSAYAVVRFSLEFVRGHPRPFAGLTYYQLLCVALGLLAGLTWFSRRERRPRV
ncbi:MAG: prolipoprotein diacylglyceryl transferase family protein [Myxococcota bacterium]